MIYRVRLAARHGFNMAAYAVGHLYLAENAAVKGHVGGYTPPDLAYIHNGRICSMAPYTRIIPCVIGYTMHGMTCIAAQRTSRPMPYPCQAVTSKTCPLIDKGLWIIYMLGRIRLAACHWLKVTGQAVLDFCLIDAHSVERIVSGDSPRPADVTYRRIWTVACNALSGIIPIYHITMVVMTSRTVAGWP